MTEMRHEPVERAERTIVHNTFDPDEIWTVPRAAVAPRLASTVTVNTTGRSEERDTVVGETRSAVVVESRGAATTTSLERGEVPPAFVAVTTK